LEKAEMMSIIVLLALALYVIFITCLLIIGSRADDRKEALFTNSIADRSDNDVASSSLAMPERMPWTPVQPQETSLKALLSGVS
jgi:hypothetical protein